VRDFALLEKVVDVSNPLKIETMRGQTDWKDAVKQYGHIPGHAVEHLSTGTLGHGELMAIGMCISAELGLLADVSDSETLERHYDIFTRMGLRTRIPDGQSPWDVLRQIRNDKNYIGGKMYAPV
jgi:3-dehydroquinate synthase